MTVVRLEPWELALAAKVGVARRAYALANGLARDRFPTSRTGVYDADVEGAASEMAVAKFLDRYWSGYVGPTKPHRGDVGSVEVRGTRVPDGHLIVRPDDPDDVWFFLVTGEAPDMDVRGCILGGAAKRPDWSVVEYGRRSYWVPQSALIPAPVPKVDR